MITFPRLATIILMLAIAPLSVPPAAAVDAAATAAAAGRQRMLSQRMAKAACFAAIGIDPAGHIAMMSDAHDLFDRTLTGLGAGDAAQGMLPETDKAVLAGLETVGGLWSDYGAAIRAAHDAGTVTPARLEVIGALNLPVLKEMNRTVGLTQRAYGDTSVPLHLAVALNISGRQRMLSQKMSKELCLIAAGQDVEGNRKALGATVGLFDASLVALIEGAADVGIRAPDGADLRAQLQTVAAIWAGFRPLFDDAIAGKASPDTTLATVAIANNTLLREMNTAVGLYELE
jgi:hypothetical protein